MLFETRRTDPFLTRAFPALRPVRTAAKDNAGLQVAFTARSYKAEAPSPAVRTNAPVGMAPQRAAALAVAGAIALAVAVGIASPASAAQSVEQHSVEVPQPDAQSVDLQPSSAGAALAAAPPPPTSADSVKLAKQLSNPVSSLISVPFEGNWDTGAGLDRNGDRYTLKIQPVVPFRLSPDLSLISRTIIPVVTQTDVTGPHRTQTGLGDVTQSLFLSPTKPLAGRFIVGFGPAALIPTGTDRALSGGKWAAGPTAVVLTQNHSWIYGVLVTQLWSFAGNSNRSGIDQFYVQPFVTYTTKKATTFGLNTETLCDWRLRHDQCAVPINATVGQLVHFGKQPISFTVGGRYYAERPAGAPNWGLRFVTTFLFPVRQH